MTTLTGSEAMQIKTAIARPMDILGLTCALMIAGGSVAHAAPRCGESGSKATAFNLTAGLDGVFFRTNTDFEEFYARTPETIAAMRSIADALKVHGTELVFIPLPPRGIVQQSKLDRSDPVQAEYDVTATMEEFRHYVLQLTKGGIHTVDVLSEIDRNNARDTFFFARDHHWTSSGARLTAKAAAAVIKSLPSYGMLSTYSFETVATGANNYIAAMGHEIQSLCGTTVEPEGDTFWSTSRNADDAADLLGDAATTTPRAALVGSSFSATPDFNFAGFLSQESKLDFINYAENGAEFISSLATLVFSKAFQEAPPPLIVWESPSYYPIDQLMFQTSRQLMAAIYGPCTVDAEVAASKPILARGKTQLLSVDPARRIGGNGYYLEISASQAGLNQMMVTIEYGDGDQEMITLGGFPRFIDDGKFYLALSDEFPAPVTGLSLDMNSGNTTLAAKLCRVPAAYRKQQG